jgi:predicted HAD superfamily Cof-like phosphohydrolase
MTDLPQPRAYPVLHREGVVLTQPSDTRLEVEAFHRKYGFPLADEPGLPLDEDRDFYLKLLDEEVQELHKAMAEGNLIETLDALADITYLTYGISLVCGVDLDAALRIVHASNMTKAFGDPAAKKGKTDAFRPPHLAELTYTEADLERTYREQ